MYKKFFTFLFVSAMMAPVQMTATPYNDNPPEDGGYNDRHRSPALNKYAYIVYEDNGAMAEVVFRSALDEVSILVYRDGSELDHIDLVATEGMEVPIYLSSYGEGNYTIQVISGSTMLAICNIIR